MRFKLTRQFISCLLKIETPYWNKSFKPLEQKFPTFETTVSHLWNFSFTPLELKFHQLETKVSPHGTDVYNTHHDV